MLTLKTQRHRRHRLSSDQAAFSKHVLLTLTEPSPIIPSVFCSQLTGASPGVVRCRSPSASRSDVLRESCLSTSEYQVVCFPLLSFKIRAASFQNNSLDIFQASENKEMLNAKKNTAQGSVI